MQNTVESATLGDEMADMRLARDQTVALRLKLEMFGVRDDAQSTFVVIREHEHPYLRKHDSVNYYHVVRESVSILVLQRNALNQTPLIN